MRVAAVCWHLNLGRGCLSVFLPSGLLPLYLSRALVSRASSGVSLALWRRLASSLALGTAALQGLANTLIDRRGSLLCVCGTPLRSGVGGDYEGKT